MNFGWTEEQEMWRSAVHDFAQKKIAPHSREIDDSGHIPEALIQEMAAMGLLAPTVSEAYGGMGMDITMAAIAAEELGRAEISLALPVMYLVQAAWGKVLDLYARPELKAELLPQVTAGKAFLGIAITEPGGGSDIEGATRCKGEKTADGWLLNGEKMYISGIREETKLKEGEVLHRRERAHGKFMRTIELPVEVEPDKVEATYLKGVLNVTLEREEAAKPRQIQVKVQ